MSDTKKYLRTEHGERIDQPDFQHAVERSQLNGLTQLVNALIVGEDRSRSAGETAQPRHFVLKGFAVRQQGSSSILEVDGGVAIVGYRYQGKVQYGAVTTDSAMKVIDVGGVTQPTATHGVYVRFRLADRDFANRAFWNSAGSSPVEEVRNVPTRLAETWQVKVEESSPGDEWMRIADVVPSTMTIVDARDFLFEGPVGGPITDSVWGGGTDRNSDRTASGVFGLRRFAMGVLRQLQDIIGAYGNWYDSVPFSLSALGMSALDYQGRGATTLQPSMAGHLDPNTDDTYDLGDDSTPRRWRTLFARAVHLGASQLANAAQATVARMYMKFLTTANTDRTLIFQADRSDGAVRGTLAVYMAQAGAELHGDVLESAFNAEWKPGSSQWERRDPSRSSGKLEVSRRGLRFYWRDSAVQGDLWNDSVAGSTNWTRALSLEDGGRLLVSDWISSLTDVYANGDVQATGDFKWASARLFAKSISGADVRINGASASVALTWGDPTSTVQQYGHLGGASGVLFYPFEVPNGATLVQVDLVMKTAGKVAISVIRMSGTAAPQHLRSAGEYVPASTGGSVITLALTLDQNTVVDNLNYSYAVNIRGTDVGTDFDLHRLTVRYRLSALELP